MTSSRAARTFLRVSIGYLLVIWGAGKLVNPAHGITVSDWLYFGWFSERRIMSAFGVLEVSLGLLVIAGIWKRAAYPAVATMTGVTSHGGSRWLSDDARDGPAAVQSRAGSRIARSLPRRRGGDGRAPRRLSQTTCAP